VIFFPVCSSFDTQTWTKVFSVNNTFYFNGIDCDPTNANHCCAVAEGFNVAGAGARIFCTTDGYGLLRSHGLP
jgi:hypothetical protein